MPQQTQPQFLLVSLGRCGTTLFQQVLCAHSGLVLSDECHWINGLHAPGVLYHQFCEADDLSVSDYPPSSKWNDGIRALNSTLFDECHGCYVGLQLIGINNLRNLPFIYSIYPNIKTIFLIRDPRDLMLSLYRTGIGHPSFVEDFELGLNAVKRFTSDFIITRYEDFVQKPRETLDTLCSFLAVEFETSMLEPFKLPISHADRSLIEKGSTTEKWRNQLTISELYSLGECYSFLKNVGYPVFEKPVFLKAEKPINNLNFAYSGIDVSWSSEKKINNHYVYSAVIQSFGVVAMTSDVNVVLFDSHDEYFAADHTIGNEKLFDLRSTKQIETIKRHTHTNYKHVFCARDILSQYDQKTIYIYSFGTETQSFLLRNQIINELDLEIIIIDATPLRQQVTFNNCTYRLISLAQLDSLTEQSVLVPTFKHYQAAKNLLVKCGVPSKQIMLCT